MKKTLALACAVVFLLCFSVTAMAAGTDDGTIFVATKDGEKFFGTELAENFVKYVAANGADSVWYDLSGDKAMNICDLVALCNNSVDFDLSGSFDSDDSAALRLLLIGKN